MIKQVVYKSARSGLLDKLRSRLEVAARQRGVRRQRVQLSNGGSRSSLPKQTSELSSSPKIEPHPPPGLPPKTERKARGSTKDISGNTTAIVEWLAETAFSRAGRSAVLTESDRVRADRIHQLCGKNDDLYR